MWLTGKIELTTVSRLQILHWMIPVPLMGGVVGMVAVWRRSCMRAIVVMAKMECQDAREKGVADWARQFLDADCEDQWITFLSRF